MNDQFSPLLFYSSLYKVCGSHFSFTNGHHTCKIIPPPVNLHFTVFDKVVSPYSQGCQAGSILHRLSWLLAAATRVLTRLSAPSKVARSEILQSEVKINNSEFPKAKNCRFFSFLDLSYEFFLTYCLLEVKISCLKKTSVQLKEYNRGTFAKVAQMLLFYLCKSYLVIKLSQYFTCIRI